MIGLKQVERLRVIGRCFVLSIVMIVLIIAGAAIAGIVVYLQNDNGDADTTAQDEELPISVTAINTPVTVSVTVLNDSEEAGTSLKAMNITSNALHGTCAINDDGGSITYVPNEGFIGPDVCNYLVCEGDHTDICSEAWFEVEVVAETDPITTVSVQYPCRPLFHLFPHTIPPI